MLFCDIETIPNIPESSLKSWEYKVEKEKKKGKELEVEEAGLYPAFNQVVCIVGALKSGDKWIPFEEINADEKTLLQNFFKFCKDNGVNKLCGHNIKGFDIPVIVLRAAANNIEIPSFLKVAGKKPWEILHEDTAEFSQIGKGKYLSLDELCLILGVDTPKDGIDGSQMAAEWEKNNKKKIKAYCKRDVKALIECYKKMKKFNII